MIKLTHSWRAMNLSYLSTINFQIQTKILYVIRPFISILNEDDHGALVEWYWQGQTEVHGEKPVIVTLCTQQNFHSLYVFPVGVFRKIFLKNWRIQELIKFRGDRHKTGNYSWNSVYVPLGQRCSTLPCHYITCNNVFWGNEVRSRT